MKRYGMDVCQGYLVEFDFVRHPLLNKIWEVLETRYDSSDRRKIYDEHHGHRIQTHGTVKRNMPGSGKKPLEFIRGEPNDDMDWTTELEFFLAGIYGIEEFFGIDSEQQQLATLQKAENAVSRMPEDIAGIQNLKEILLENVKCLQYYRKEFRFAEIIPNKEFKPRKFTTLESFSEEFIKHAVNVLQQGKIPDFEFGYSLCDYLAIETLRVADCISSYFFTESFSALTIGFLLEDIFNLAICFEINHSKLFDSDIMSNETRKNKQKISKIMQSLNNSKNKDVWKQYNNLKEKNPKLTDANIARKIFNSNQIFNSTEGVKTCIKDGKKYCRVIQKDSSMKDELVGMGADLNALPQHVT